MWLLCITELECEVLQLMYFSSHEINLKLSFFPLQWNQMKQYKTQCKKQDTTVATGQSIKF
jgi:hypothetical protein